MGAYDQCSFNLDGKGTFRAGEGTKPYVGERGERHNEPEVRMEMLYPVYRESSIMSAMRQAHPYEEIAFDLYLLANSHQGIGSGLIGEWEDPLDEQAFLGKLKSTFGLTAIRHSKIQGRSIRRVALCGGSGSFLLEKAVAARADAFVTGDMKYHQFFDVDGRLLLADIGHYGSEQLTPRLIRRWLGEQFPTFAVRLTEIVTDPIYHF